MSQIALRFNPSEGPLSATQCRELVLKLFQDDARSHRARRPLSTSAWPPIPPRGFGLRRSPSTSKTCLRTRPSSSSLKQLGEA